MTWRCAKLSNIADIERDGIASEAISTGTRYLGLEHIEAGGKILGAATVEAGDLASTKFRFTSRHVLYGKLRPYLAKIVTPDFDGICSTDIVPIMPGPQLDRSFLTHFLRQPSMIEFANSRTSGANLPRLSPKALADFEIPLPPLDEQKRIAAILDQADDLRRKRRQALDRLNQLGQAIFYEMFGGAEKEISIHEYLDDIESGKNLVGVDDDNDSGYRVLKISAVSRSGFRSIETKPLPATYVPPSRHLVKDGDLLFSRANTTELVGIPCIVEDVGPNVALPDKLWRLVPSPTKALSAFLCHALLSPASRRQIEKMCSGTSGSMQNISIAKFKSIRVPKASLEKQMIFHHVLSELYSVKRRVEIYQNKADALFAVLQHHAFRGELTALPLKEVAS